MIKRKVIKWMKLKFDTLMKLLIYLKDVIEILEFFLDFQVGWSLSILMNLVKLLFSNPISYNQHHSLTNIKYTICTWWLLPSHFSSNIISTCSISTPKQFQQRNIKAKLFPNIHFTHSFVVGNWVLKNINRKKKEIKKEKNRKQ